MSQSPDNDNDGKVRGQGETHLRTSRESPENGDNRKFQSFVRFLFF